MRFNFFTLLLASVAAAERLIEATALIPCSEDTEISATKFDVVFKPDSASLVYDIDLQVQIDGYVYATIDLYAYGFLALSKTLDPCSTSSSLKQMCPLTSGSISISSTATLSSDVLNSIPGVAFTVPNIDAFAIVKVYLTETKTQTACIRIELSNTKSVTQTSVKWVTAIISGIGLLVSAVLTFFGSGWTAQRIGATAGLMFSYFQSVVIVDMEAVDRVPPMASGWADNLSWSVGMIYTSFMQKIFRWYVQATGGSPETYMIYATVSTLVQRQKKRALDALQWAIPPRVADFARYQYNMGVNIINDVLFELPDYEAVTSSDQKFSLSKRANALVAETKAESSTVLYVIRGIKRVAWNAGIESTSAVLTSFTIFVFVCVVVALVFMMLSFVVWLVSKGDKTEKHKNVQQYRGLLPSILKGTVLNLLLIAFPSIMVFSLWEFVNQDSAAVIVIAVIFLVLTLVILGWNCYKMVMIALRSKRETGTPAALLYSHAPTMHRYGFLYQRFHSDFYWFAPLYLAYHFIVALFIAFAQSNGQVQGLALFVIELALLVLVCYFKPFMDKSTNVINIAMQVIKTLNALFFLFYSNLLTQPLAVSAILGVIHFVMNAAFSLILLLYILIYSGMQLWRKNPDAYQDPAKDDRLSFISEKGLMNRPHNDELMALGVAAQADHEPMARPEWFTNEDSPNPFDNPNLPHPPTAGYRDSRQISERTNTMTSVPTFDEVDARMHNNHYRADSQASFGFAQNNGSGTVSESSLKPAGNKKWWKLK